MKILILCTGNSCRSQMAEGFVQCFAPAAEVHSAGTAPAERVHPLAVKVMQEKGIDLSGHRPKSVDQFLSQPFDHVITVCGDAEENCPAFIGTVKHRWHIGFEDPAKVTGTEAFVLSEFRRIRDDIEARFGEFVRKETV
ncbi:MAG: arsenate reductase ArsC [Bacteroidetes bacterium]|jgi:arsenate reductase|nr:arsenate reductase ArsC [Bacteroidota bacterium]